MKSEKKKINKLAICIGCIWSIYSVIFGEYFIKCHIDIGMNNSVFGTESCVPQYLWSYIAHILAINLIFLLCFFLVKAFFFDGKERKIFLFSLPIFIMLLSYFLSSVDPTNSFINYYVGDEKNIWDASVRLWPFAFVYTSEIYLISFYMIPVVFAPSIIKILFTSLVIGYVVYRVREYYHTNLAFLLYATVCLSSFFEMGIRVHRMHWYGYMYLFWAVKIFFDSKIHYSKFDMKTVLLMSSIGALLTVWRREGIYLLIFGIILLVFTYGREKGVLHKDGIVKIIIVYLIFQVVLFLPTISKNGVNERGATYSAYLTHMLGESSLDRDKIQEELEIANQYLDIDILDKYNQDLGVKRYEDCCYLWPDWLDGQYYAFKKGTSLNDDKFAEAVISIILKQPVTFAKSRVRATYAAFFQHGGYNLFLPLMLLLVVIIYSLLKKDKVLFILSFGVLVHIGITALTMPASYYKYFYQMFLFAYFFIGIVLIDYYKK